jgi:hypothetical protein
VRAYTRLSEAAKALSTRDHVRGISGPSTLLSTRGRAVVVLSIRRGVLQIRRCGKLTKYRAARAMQSLCPRPPALSYSPTSCTRALTID